MEWSDKTTPVDQGRATWWRKWDHDYNRFVIVYCISWLENGELYLRASESPANHWVSLSISLKSSISQWCSTYFLFNVCLKKVMWMVGFDKNSGDRDSGPSERWHVRTTRVRHAWGSLGRLEKALFFARNGLKKKVVQRWYVAHCTGILIFTTYSYIWLYMIIYDYMHVLHKKFLSSIF